FFFFQAEDGIRDRNVTGVQTCALPILELDDAARACTAEPWNLLNVYSQSDTANFNIEAEITVENENLAFSYTLSVSGKKQMLTSSEERRVGKESRTQWCR